jgi:hypothetical protein
MDIKTCITKVKELIPTTEIIYGNFPRKKTPSLFICSDFEDFLKLAKKLNPPIIYAETTSIQDYLIDIYLSEEQKEEIMMTYDSQKPVDLYLHFQHEFILHRYYHRGTRVEEVEKWIEEREL